MSAAVCKLFPSWRAPRGTNGSKHSHHGNFLSYTHWDPVCQSLSPGSPPINISLPTYLTTSSRGPVSQPSMRCLLKAVTAADRWQSLCGSPPSPPRSTARHPCSTFWEQGTDSSDLDFSPVRRQQQCHQWISPKLKPFITCSQGMTELKSREWLLHCASAFQTIKCLLQTQLGCCWWWQSYCNGGRITPGKDKHSSLTWLLFPGDSKNHRKEEMRG